MKKAIRDFLIYDAFFAVIMITIYLIPDDTEWGYFGLCVLFLPTIYFIQPIFGLLLGYRAIKKHQIPCLRFFALSLLLFLINSFTFYILSIERILAHGLIETFTISDLVPGCIFIAFYWLSYFITKFYLKFYF